jgi:hypothetical protein
MALEHMTAIEIVAALDEIGETGTAQLRQGNALYTQREANAAWLFVGTVADPEAAQQLLRDHFNA